MATRCWLRSPVQPSIDSGATATAYFPRIPHGIPIRTRATYSKADVAVVAGSVSGLGIQHLAMADRHGSAVGGSAVVLLGYPTGVEAILAATGPATLQVISASSQGEPKQVMEELARRHLIKPVVTQGHIGDVFSGKIVYDAQMTSGGSGGPLFDDQGQAIGINFAMIRDFRGSNFAIPVRYAKALLKK